MGSSDDFATSYVAAFNAAVAAGDYAEFLAGFTDDAVLRFENVPGAGLLEFVGRTAYTAAYVEQPPDDQLDIVAPVEYDGSALLIAFTWRRDRAPGTIRLTLAEGLISRMTVTFKTAPTVRQSGLSLEM